MSQTDRLLRAPGVGRRLGLSTKDALRLMVERRLPIVVVDGIGHVPESALDEAGGTDIDGTSE